MLGQSHQPGTAHSAGSARIDWVDCAKGLCIVLVVMLHATLGVEKAMGETSVFSAIIDWARPFRMPDFFLISGLFLARRIDRPWRGYLDSKVLHFVYFYILWVNIQLGLKAPHFISELGWAGFAKLYFSSYVIPFSSLWFIYLLGIYFVAAKLLSRFAKPVVFVAAAALHMFMPESGIFIVDQFSDRFVFFYTGYAAATLIFDFAGRVGRLGSNTRTRHTILRPPGGLGFWRWWLWPVYGRFYDCREIQNEHYARAVA